MKVLKLLCSIAFLPALMAGGYGGGGTGGDVTTPGAGTGVTGTVTTYRDTTLPGRLLLNAPSGRAVVYDLHTGVGSSLPSGSSGDYWTAGAAGTRAILAKANVPGSGSTAVSIYETSSWSQVAQFSLSSSFSNPKLSPDGRYVATFWTDDSSGEGSEDMKLTIIDAASGKVVKRGSKIDGELAVLSPFAWLPDGTYVYLAWNQIYRSSPDSSSSQLIATLNLPDNGALQNGSYAAGYSYLTASPDGKKLAFTWTEYIDGTNRRDTNIWVVNIDGTDLRAELRVRQPNLVARRAVDRGRALHVRHQHFACLPGGRHRCSSMAGDGRDGLCIKPRVRAACAGP